MSLRGTMGAGLLLLGAVLPAPAQTTLEWKFKEGDKFYIEAVTDTKQTVTVGEKPTSLASTYTTVSQFEVQKAAAGAYTLKQTVVGVQVKSNKPDDPVMSTISRFAAQFKGTTFTFTMAPNGTITSKTLEGYDDLIKKLTGGNESAEKEARARYPEDMFRDELSRIFVPFPDKPVSKGDTWLRKETLAIPNGTLTGEITYTYDGRDPKDAEQIKVNQKWSYALPKGGSGGGRVTKGELKVDQATGRISVDPAAGRLIRNEESKHITGKLTYTDTTMKEITSDIDQTTTRTFRRVDENPLK
jgi:hypothetical protein